MNTKNTVPNVIRDEVNSKASFFLSFVKNVVNIGINDADNAPAITTWKMKSGILKAARKTPKSDDAPNKPTKSLYFKTPKNWDRTVVNIINEAAVKILVCRDVKALILRLTIFETIFCGINRQ